MLSLDISLRHARLAQIAFALDRAETGGRLLLFTAPRPEAGALITTQTRLVDLPLAKPCTHTLTGGVLALKAIPVTLALRSGIAAWARFTTGPNGFDSNGTWVMDCDVTRVDDTTIDAEVRLDSLQLYAGGSVIVGTIEFME